ncbi:hypothetical protein ACFE04_005603 [Oxalis oulophora]
MERFMARLHAAIVVFVAVWILVAGLYGLLKPSVSNGCTMTYMYPTYIPISTPERDSSAKYGLYLYHEGWEDIDFDDHIKHLTGIPVLFIPGNGGSYKQVRSLAVESERAYQAGPLKHTYYQQSLLTPEEGGAKMDLGSFQFPRHYVRQMDWFAVDLEEELSAMDARILEQQTEYVVYAIHRILDQYKESQDAREKEGVPTPSPRSLPKSVILVGHSMGGFVARAAVTHPRLRKSAVETLLTLSSPHQSPPLPLQPSLGRYFSRVNQEWRKGYEIQTTHTGHYVSDPLLSHVIAISISGGHNDYQVRSKLESLEGIVPYSHGFMMSSTRMKNVWLSMEHQSILWCNQLVVQVARTILSLIEPGTGQPVSDPQKRLAIFARMMQPQLPPQLSTDISKKDVEFAHGSLVLGSYNCPSNISWNYSNHEKDLHIKTSTITVLAMDGKRRWLDIDKLGSNGKNHFVLVTNLAPCFGIRLHLWTEKSNSTDFTASKRIVEVTSKMVHIPTVPAQSQTEPGSQTEQPPPSAVFWMTPEDMRGFKFMTVSVAPQPSVSGGPPPAPSMAVGQFFDLEEGKRDLSPQFMLLSTSSPKDLFLKENHPLASILSFAVSLGLLPVTLSMKIVGCGISNYGIPDDKAAGDLENFRLCKLRCFSPVALAWDSTSDVQIFPNVYGENIVIDSSPGLWDAEGSEKTFVMLLVDPHCSYKTSIAVSVTGAASRFLLLYNAQIVGFSMAVIFFALMRQATAWDLDLPAPSVLAAVESNLRMLSSFLLLAVAPIFLSLVISLLMSQPLPAFASFTLVSVICYLLANGAMILIILISELVLYCSAKVHVLIKMRSQAQEGKFGCASDWFTSLSSSLFSLQVVRILRDNPILPTAMAAIILGTLVHSAIGLFILSIYHALACHISFYSILSGSFCGQARGIQLNKGNSEGSIASKIEDQTPNSPKQSRKFIDTQLDIFNHQHGLLILHFLAAFMLAPSLVASLLQRKGTSRTSPWFLDSVLCIGVILHGILNSNTESISSFTFPSILGYRLRLSNIYLFAGYYTYLSGLALAPYRVFYALAVIGFILLACTIVQRRTQENNEMYVSGKRRTTSKDETLHRAVWS